MVRLIREELLVVQAVAITLDCWTSIQKYPYLGVTCHFFNRSLELCNRTLTIYHLLGNHTYENISKEWNILGKIMSITTDNAKNMSNITKNIQDQLKKHQSRFRKIHQLGCTAHVLN
ncbi:zinc finger BED domain-containing 1-like [Brachionus plicatilis]|uniref:Zinc finger BED domain-containing 1-like n=1 Tax=Brachionus plicatilis TaxID=10195 RepID=A0A3M7PH19_BRAPC|nr:zinc finger BED domain-containing 1-like [Brachionus plicatilis]